MVTVWWRVVSCCTICRFYPTFQRKFLIATKECFGFIGAWAWCFYHAGPKSISRKVYFGIGWMRKAESLSLVWSKLFKLPFDLVRIRRRWFSSSQNFNSIFFSIPKWCGLGRVECRGKELILGTVIYSDLNRLAMIEFTLLNLSPLGKLH